MSVKKIKQHDISDCGVACLVSIAAHYKLFIPISKVRQFTATDQEGTNLYGIIEGAKKLGFDAKGIRCDLKDLKNIPIPAIAHVIVNQELQHFVVIRKVTKKVIEIMDPGTGAFHSISMKKFKEQWTGVLVILLPNEHFIPKNERVSVLLRFWHLVKPHKYMLVQSVIGSIFYTLLGFSISIYIQKITDHVLVSGNLKLLHTMSIIMVVLMIIQLLLFVFKDLFLIKSGQEIDARLILGYYKHLLKLPQQFFDTMRTGEIISRINDAMKIRLFINNTSLTLLVNFFIVIFSFLLMFSYYWKLGLIMFTIIPLYMIIYVVTDSVNKKTERKIMESSAELENQLIESISAISTIKQFNLHSMMQIKTERKFIKLLQVSYYSSMNHVFSQTSSQSLSNLFTILLLWIGSYFVIGKELTPGELFSFYAILGFFTSPVSGLILSNKIIQNALIAADRLFEILDLDTEESGNVTVMSKIDNGNILFKNVAFSYGNRPTIFSNLNLSIHQGKITAIIGESGSGKSTILHLLQGLYSIKRGEIFINGNNIKYYSKASLRNLIGIVPQKVQLFNGTVASNIALGEINPDMKRIMEVCRRLKITSFIENLPQGFHSKIGENGTYLSGGERQRIAIARALYRDPDIIAFDEASTSLDSFSEQILECIIQELIKDGKTIIIITHRVQKLSNADRILVLKKGELIEEGSPDYLLNSNKGIFRDLWIKQEATTQQDT
ncbi:peptidase domain-containing ABC transporter [Lutimonas sp.]|uniref:peptidase domain-containing ABC transporter n=1 Tax=Lutimonas sp. TaxID=1872403 RepID=UPI003D9B9B75